MTTKLQERDINSQVNAANVAQITPGTTNRHRQLGMQTNWWTVKETFSVSSVICTLLFVTSVGAGMVTSRSWHFLVFVPLNICKPFIKALKCASNCKISTIDVQFTASHLKLEKIQLKEQDRAAGIHFCSSWCRVSREKNTLQNKMTYCISLSQWI